MNYNVLLILSLLYFPPMLMSFVEIRSGLLRSNKKATIYHVISLFIPGINWTADVINYNKFTYVRLDCTKFFLIFKTNKKQM